MARKRVSENDLLDFQNRADELSREVEEKYERMDSKKKPEPVPEPMRDIGLLLIHDVAGSSRQLVDLGLHLKKAGYAVELVDLFGYNPRDRFDRTPEWQRWLNMAQSGYLNLSNRAARICVVGSGDSCVLAALIAEQYPIEMLVTVGGGPRRTAIFPAIGNKNKTALARIARIARNNLFSIVCPILNIVTDKCGSFSKASVALYKTDTRSDNVQRVNLPDTDVTDIWISSAKDAENTIMNFVNRQ